MAEEGIKQFLGLAMVLLVIVLVVGGLLFIFPSIRTYFGNAFSYNDSRIQPNTNAGNGVVGEGGIKFSDSCYEKFPDCKICMIYFAKNEKGEAVEGNKYLISEMNFGGDIYLFAVGTAGCKGNVFFRAWKDNWFKDELVFEKLSDFSGENVYTAFAKFKPSEKGEYYFMAFSDSDGKNVIQRADSKTETKSANIKAN